MDSRTFYALHLKVRKIVFFLLVFGCFSATAQEDTLYWPTDTAWWCVQDWHYDQQSGETESEFKYYKMYGDTVANGNEWQKVHFSKHLAFDSPHNHLHCLTRLEDKRVHIKYMPTSGYADTNEYTLYDFNLQVGDTFQFHLLSWETDSVFEFQLGAKTYTILTSSGHLRIDYVFHELSHSVPMWGGSVNLVDFLIGRTYMEPSTHRPFGWNTHSSSVLIRVRLCTVSSGAV